MSPEKQRRIIAAAILGALVLAGVIALVGGGGGGTDRFGPTQADPLPYEGRSPAIPPGKTERVLIELPRPALGASAKRAKESDRSQRFYVRSLEQESRALVSALRARDVQMRDVVTFERCWHGFAATIRAKDLPEVQSVGARVRANRRFFPAFSQPVPGTRAPIALPPGNSPSVTLLAGGVPGATGYDAIDRDSRPLPGTDPRDPQRREVGGEPLADTLHALGVRVRVVRVSGLQDGEEYARTDTLLAGLERTVDPDRDGDTGDHDPAALIGIAAPYAGFADAPESVAVRAAKRFGTTVVAPGGENGTGTGTVASPAASTGAIGVGALGTPAAVARTTLRVGDLTVTGAALLAKTPFPGTLTTVRPPAANTTAALLVGNEDLTGKLAVVEAGGNPSARVAAAAGAGAAAVVLADARSGHVVPTMPAGRVDVPVVGVTGPAARAILDLEPGAKASTSGLRAPKNPLPGGTQSRFAAAGTSFEAIVKPDLVRPGSAVVSAGVISGSAVAAAQVAADVARGTDVSPTTDTAAGDPPAPPTVAISGLTASTPGAVAFTVGRFDRGDPDGGRPATVVPAGRLQLTLTKADSETVIERLTPPGGQRGVLPGAYAYTLPKGLIGRLDAGDYVFRVTASAPRQTDPTTAVSNPIAIK